jgi:hypothetical protein
MKIQLEEKWRDILTKLPESGMGYQNVRFIFKNGNMSPGLKVLNSSVIELPDNVTIDMDNVKSIFFEG